MIRALVLLLWSMTAVAGLPEGQARELIAMEALIQGYKGEAGVFIGRYGCDGEIEKIFFINTRTGFNTSWSGLPDEDYYDEFMTEQYGPGWDDEDDFKFGLIKVQKHCPKGMPL